MKKIYIIKSNEFYKIGVSECPEERLLQLQTGNPNQLELLHVFNVNNASKVESWLHLIYQTNKVHGEWFDLTTEDLNILPKLLRDYDIYNSSEYMLYCLSLQHTTVLEVLDECTKVLKDNTSLLQQIDKDSQ